MLPLKKYLLIKIKRSNMKKYIGPLIVALFLISVSFDTSAQQPFQGAPDPYTNGNGTGIQGGGLHNAAPIDGGLGILLVLATGFGIRKVYNAKKNKQEK
jgi:hypothetical protein